MDNKRIDAIDVAKGVGIALVVVGHMVSGLLNQLIYSFHMPLFFIISGICFNESKHKSFLLFMKKRFRGLIIPLIAFSLFFYFFSICFSWVKRGFPEEWPPGLWFLPILFLSEVLWWWTCRLLSKTMSRILSLVFVISIAILLYYCNVLLPLNLSSVFIATFFYGLGSVIRHQTINALNKGGTINVLIGIVLLFTTMLYSLFRQGSINLHYNDLNGFLSVLFAVSGSIGMLLLCPAFIRVKKILVFLGRNTICILGVHLLIIQILEDYLRPYIDNLIAYKIMELFIVCGLSLLCCIVVNKWVPFVVGKTKNS